METLNFVTITPTEAAKILSAGNGDAALVLLYIRATGDRRLQQAATRLRMSPEKLAWAENLLSRLGLLEVSKQEPPQYDPSRAPQYTSDQIVSYQTSNPDFSLLQDEIASRLGRPLSTEELRRLLTMRDYLKMPPEVIDMALTYCLQRAEYYSRKDGSKQHVNVRTLEKECYTWANAGITTLQSAAEYISRGLARLQPENQVKKVLQLDHPLVQGEREYIDSWLAMGFDVEAIRIAYEKTVLATGKLNWRYLNKILLNWNEKNLHTPEEIRGKDRPAASSGKAAAGGYTVGPSEKTAIARMKELLAAEKAKEGAQ